MPKVLIEMSVFAYTCFISTFLVGEVWGIGKRNTAFSAV